MRSVFGQTYDNIEYIVIDGASSDNTLEVVRKYSDQIGYWRSEPDRGAYDAMNKGIALARGELIGILNSDDWYEPDAVSAAVEAFLANPRCILHGDLRRFKGDTYLSTRLGPTQAGINLRAMEENHPTMFVPASVYADIGVFDQTTGSIADWDFVLRCHKAGIRFIHLGRVISNFRIGGMSSTTTFSRAHEKWRLRKRFGYRFATTQYMREFFRASMIYAAKASGLYRFARAVIRPRV